MRNPFAAPSNNESQMMADQREYDRERSMLESATHPQNSDEMMHMERENLMAELTRWQQDLSPMLQNLFKNLAGCQEDGDGQLKIIPGYQALCNVSGARRFVDTIKPIDKNVMNGAWTIRQINDAMIALDDTNVQDIIEHWEEYGIEYSVASMDRICETIIYAMYPTFLRGLDNGERKHHGQIQKIVETKNIGSEKRRNSLLKV